MKIGVLGYNSNLTKEALWHIAHADEDAELLTLSTIAAFMSDGTIYDPVKTGQANRGIKYDQIILVDDYRWEILNKQKDIINDFKFCELKYSCVPEDFQILKYEW